MVTGLCNVRLLVAVTDLCNVRLTELADESITDAVDTYVDWLQHQPPPPSLFTSPRQPPQQALFPPTSSSSPVTTSDRLTTSSQLVFVPMNARSDPGDDRSSSVIADWLLAARFVHGLSTSYDAGSF